MIKTTRIIRCDFASRIQLGRWVGKSRRYTPKMTVAAVQRHLRRSPVHVYTFAKVYRNAQHDGILVHVEQADEFTFFVVSDEDGWVKNVIGKLVHVELIDYDRVDTQKGES